MWWVVGALVVPLGADQELDGGTWKFGEVRLSGSDWLNFREHPWVIDRCLMAVFEVIADLTQRLFVASNLR
jgi:hypothetical protein